MNFDILVPVSFFIVVFGVIALLLKHKARRREELYETLRVALQSGHHVQNGVLDRLALAADPKRNDLRVGIVFLVMTLVVVLLSQLLPFGDANARRALLSIAVIPGALALTYFAFWGLWYRRPNAPEQN